MAAVLRGITWNHTRGLLPLVATAQRFAELHPETRIVWETRSLQAFADAPLDELARNFDLLVVDHPHMGEAARTGSLLPLDDHMSAEFLEDQALNQVGRSHDTYRYAGKSWALAIDAATPVASWNAEAQRAGGIGLPRSWDDLMAMATTGAVAVPAIPIDSLMNWYALCTDIDGSLFADSGRLVDPSTGAEALNRLADLVRLCPASCLERNPIAVYEALCNPTDPALYCPFAYGYANYAQDGYAAARLAFGEPPLAPSGGPLRTTLGGTGLAISASTKHRQAALAYAAYTAGPEVQSGLYVRAGGQPGHREAWTRPEANAWVNGYFSATLPVLDRAYHRPRYDGYMQFQDEAGLVVHRVLRGETDCSAAIAEMNRLYLESLHDSPPIETL